MLIWYPDQIMNPVQLLYGERARQYNMSSKLYYLIGVRQMLYRKKAVAAMKLQPGGSVLEIGCGTGINFTHIEKLVGQQGHIVGLDFTAAMLAKARVRIHKSGWSNIALVQADARSELGRVGLFDAVLCSFVLTTLENPASVLSRARDVLRPGGRLVVLDVKYNCRKVLNPAALWLTQYYGTTDESLKWTPEHWMERELDNTSFESYYFGFTFIAAGEKPRISRVRRVPSLEASRVADTSLITGEAETTSPSPKAPD